jgi:hypothetical protein
MSLDLTNIQNRVTELQNMIQEFEVSKREQAELQEMRNEAAEEGKTGAFIAPTAEGFRAGERYFPKLGVHIRGWRKYWHKWNGNKKEIVENPSPKDIEKKKVKRGADLTIQVLEPTDAMGTYTLSLAPTSYYNWTKYVDSLGNMGLEPHKVLTVLSFRMKQYDEGNPVSLVQFQYVPFNSPEAQEAIGTPAEWR